MFKKKKKKIEDISTESIIPFVIPQISKSPVHIKRKDKKFVMTPAFSAIWGRANIDELVTPPTDPIPYSDRSLDPFRSQEKRKIAEDDYKEFESVTIRNADRQKIFPGSRPIGDANKKDKFEEMDSPIKNESRSKRIESEYKRPIIEEKPKVEEVYVKDEIDEELLYNDPVYVDVNKQPEEVIQPKEDIDDFISSLEIIDEEDEFKPVSIEVEEFNENEYKEEIIEKPAVKVEQPKPEVKKEVIDKPKPKKNDYAKYKLPPLSIFKVIDNDDSVRHEWIQDQLDTINRTLQEFNIDGNVVNYTKGPSVTRYEVELAAGVSVKKITGIEENLKMNLAAKSLHIEAPIPGKAYVGIEVPNKVVEMVNFGNICHSDEFKNSSKLSFGVGIDLNGNTVVAPINKMPHGLIAGTTGSGKSVCSHSLIISLLLKNKPDELKLMLIDPKAVEFVFYEELPHLVTPIISDPKLASQALKWACDEMDNRYKMFAQHRVRNIEDFNYKIENEGYSEPKMPYMLILIDELADLMQTASADVEQS
ncbi:MAG: DNA translocase FtsK, partial [Bacilli bacterium]|nr:DNA translocase FtsK [Bacilli bacterium]